MLFTIFNLNILFSMVNPLINVSNIPLKPLVVMFIECYTTQDLSDIFEFSLYPCKGLL